MDFPGYWGSSGDGPDWPITIGVLIIVLGVPFGVGFGLSAALVGPRQYEQGASDAANSAGRDLARLVKLGACQAAVLPEEGAR